MAAITLTSVKNFSALQSAATGTTTDWIAVPPYVTLAIVHLQITTAGTNTILTLKAAPPIQPYDDARVITFLTSATITAIGYHQYVIGDVGATAVADAAAVNTMVTLATAVPTVLGITTTPTGSTYSTAVEFKRY